MPILCEIYDKKKNELILIIKPNGKMETNDLDLFIDFMNKKLVEKHNFKCIFDLREMEDAPLPLIMKLAKYMKLKRGEMIGRFTDSIIIVESTIIKGFLNILFNLVEPVSKYYIISKVEELNAYLL